MEDFVKIFKSPDGDVYHITLSEDNGVLSVEVLKALGSVHVAGIDLRRLFGKILYQTLRRTLCHHKNTEADCLRRCFNGMSSCTI